MRLAEHADPSGMRTIGTSIYLLGIFQLFLPQDVAGVLTKPDLVTTAAHKARWMDVISGNDHPLKHGYYCTKQPDDDERANGITAEAARAAEADFFTKAASQWMARHVDTRRFGTPHLVTSLSNLLANMISEKYVGSR